MKVQVDYRSMIGVAALAVIVVVVLASGCSPAVPNSPTGEGIVNNDTITVIGFGEATGAPDVAYIDFAVSVSGDLDTVVDEVDTQLASVREALIRAGVDEEDILASISYIYSEEIYDPDTGELSGERSYTVEGILSVIVRDTTATDEVLRAALGAGSVNVQWFGLSISDTDDLEAEARAQAMEDAQGCAEQLADLMGVTLGEPVVVIETFFGPTYTGSGYIDTGVSVEITVTYTISR